VLLAAVDGDAAVGTFEIDMGRGHAAAWLVVGVRAARMLLYKGRALPDFGNGGVREGVEEVVCGENSLRPGLGWGAS
jgi:hypothetical protein